MVKPTKPLKSRSGSSFQVDASSPRNANGGARSILLLIGVLVAVALVGKTVSNQGTSVDLLALPGSVSCPPAATTPPVEAAVKAAPPPAAAAKAPHGSALPAPYLVIDKTSLRAFDRSKLNPLKQFTREDHEPYMVDDPGKEHYALWHWLTTTYGDDRHVLDIGTRFVTSALALGASGTKVKTVDIPQSTERGFAFRGGTEADWQKRVKEHGVDIEFKNLVLTEIPDEEFRALLGETWMVVLDTYHKPYTYPFEIEFLKRVVDMRPKFEGIMLLDDINLDDEMRRWWTEVQTNAATMGYIATDITSIGHLSGTGLLDFSGGKVVIKE